MTICTICGKSDFKGATGCLKFRQWGDREWACGAIGGNYLFANVKYEKNYILQKLNHVVKLITPHFRARLEVVSCVVSPDINMGFIVIADGVLRVGCDINKVGENYFSTLDLTRRIEIGAGQYDVNYHVVKTTEPTADKSFFLAQLDEKIAELWV